MSLFDSFLGAVSSAFDKGHDWYCDNCGAYMNTQLGFTTETDEWICTECGSVNDVSEYNILDEDEDDSDNSSIYDEEDDDDCVEERISADEAGDIYRCSGCDEDYMFGYSEEELNK